MIKVLSIAGSDPSGGAGIQADLKTFQALGAFGMAVPSSLTVQNSRGVRGVFPISHRIMQQQLTTLFSDIKPDAIKTGMLLKAAAVCVVADAVQHHKIKKLVVDPVVRSSSGRQLLVPDAVKTMKRRLFPLALIITPNIPEAEALTGMAITTDSEIDYAAGKLLDMGPAYVLIKGGHRLGPAVDTLYGGKTVLSFSTNRKKGEFHGTGCMLSSAIAVFTAQGYSVEKAVEKGKLFVDSMLKAAKPVGKNRNTRYFQF